MRRQPSLYHMQVTLQRHPESSRCISPLTRTLRTAHLGCDTAANSRKNHGGIGFLMMQVIDQQLCASIRGPNDVGHVHARGLSAERRRTNRVEISGYDAT